MTFNRLASTRKVGSLNLSVRSDLLFPKPIWRASSRKFGSAAWTAAHRKASNDAFVQWVSFRARDVMAHAHRGVAILDTVMNARLSVNCAIEMTSEHIYP